MKSLSIIIPMYNVEPYVERCLRSLENQDIPHDDYEIICINDGSPDGSREVVIKLQIEFNNIILLDQVNQGVSSARNKGLEHAQGKYILMIDPDDYVVPGIFSNMLSYADEHSAEVSFLGFQILNEDGTIKKNILNKNERGKVFTGITASQLSRGDGKTDPDRMVAVIFNRKFFMINNFKYLTNVPYLEDGEFIARILTIASRCVFYGKLFYIRTTRPGSATNSDLFLSRRATDGFVRSAINLKEFRDSNNFNDEQKGYLNTKIIKFIVLATTSVLRSRNLHRFFELKRKFKENELDYISLDRVSNSYLRYGKRINQSLTALIVFLLFNSFRKKISILR